MDNDIQNFELLRQASCNRLHHFAEQIDIFIRYSEEIKSEDECIIGRRHIIEAETCINFFEHFERFTRSMIRRQIFNDFTLIKVQHKDRRQREKARWVVMKFLGYCQKWLIVFIEAVESKESQVWLAGDDFLDLLPVTLSLLQA
jgi:hypothetical protein